CIGPAFQQVAHRVGPSQGQGVVQCGHLAGVLPVDVGAGGELAFDDGPVAHAGGFEPGERIGPACDREEAGEPEGEQVAHRDGAEDYLASKGTRRSASLRAAFSRAVLPATCSAMSMATSVWRSVATNLPVVSLRMTSMRARQETRLPRRMPSSLKASPVRVTTSVRPAILSAGTTSKPRVCRRIMSSVWAAGSITGRARCCSTMATETAGRVLPARSFLRRSTRAS